MGIRLKYNFPIEPILWFKCVPKYLRLGLSGATIVFAHGCLKFYPYVFSVWLKSRVGKKIVQNYNFQKELRQKGKKVTLNASSGM
jgi:hypothetical protein